MVKSPGQVTLTCYAPCPDITKTVTPDFKYPDVGQVVYVNLSGRSGLRRLGGSALATVFAQLGDESADMDDVDQFGRCFRAVQQLVSGRLVVSGHDVSDGGLIVALLEMAFAGNTGLQVLLPVNQRTKGSSASREELLLGELFAEELGFVFEVLPQNLDRVLEVFGQADVPAYSIGKVLSEKSITVEVCQYIGQGDEQETVLALQRSMVDLRDLWESTSFSLELLQCNPQCVVQERDGLREREGPAYRLTYPVAPTADSILLRPSVDKPRVAVIRQEGSNGDREMLAAFHAAGFQAWDVNMTDLLDGGVRLDGFRGLAFCGGFSYADVHDSAKGWAGAIRFNPHLLQEFSRFRDRRDTFSLGVCNGCQLMALLGWVPFPGEKIVLEEGQTEAEGHTGEGKRKKRLVEFPSSSQARFVHNASGRYESRWVAVKVLDSPAVLLKDMQNSTLGQGTSPL